MNELRVVLTAENFKQLVRGDVLELKQTNLSVLSTKVGEPIVLKVILQDIGHIQMIDIIAAAMQK